MQKINPQKSKNNQKPGGKDKNKQKGKQQRKPDVSMRDNDENFDEEELDDLDDEDMMFDDDIDDESELFWKLEVKENEQNTMEVPEHFDGIVCVTQASFGENVTKGSRTVVCCQTPFLTEPTPICVLTQGTHETHSLNLKFSSPADFSIKGNQPSTVYLSGYVDIPPLDNLSGFPDEDYDIPQNVLSKMKRRYDDEEAEQLEPAAKKRKVEAPKGKKAVEIKKTPEAKKPQQENKPGQTGKKKQQQSPQQPQPQQEKQPEKQPEQPTANKKPETEAPQVPQNAHETLNPTTATGTDQPNTAKLSKSQRKKLRKQQQNGKQTEENKPDNAPKEETAPKVDNQQEKPQQTEEAQKDNAKPQTSEKIETTTPSNEGEKTNDSPTKNGTKAAEDKAGDSKEKSNKQQKQQEKKLVEKKFPNGIEIKDLKIGNGADVRNGQVLHLLYAGQLADKTVFDKQLSGGGFQYKFGSDEGIKGWHLGMKGMKVGGKRRITVPPKFAFGVDGNATKNVPGDATVTYTIEILEEPKQ